MVAEQTSQKNPGNFLLPVLILVLVALSFGIGVLWQKVENLEKGTNANLGANALNANQPASQPRARVDPLTPVAESDVTIEKAQGDDHVRGDKNAKLTLIEYSDLECPYCRLIHPDLQKLMTQYQGKLKWVYRHYPLSQIHPNAQKAGEAAECAYEAGGDAKFWEFVDTIFKETETTKLTADVLPDFAEKVGLNQDTFKTCLDSGRFAKKVDEQQAQGTSAGVQGTPAGFLYDGKGNVYKIEGALPYDTLKQMVDKALQG